MPRFNIAPPKGSRLTPKTSEATCNIWEEVRLLGNTMELYLSHHPSGPPVVGAVPGMLEGRWLRSAFAFLAAAT